MDDDEANDDDISALLEECIPSEDERGLSVDEPYVSDDTMWMLDVMCGAIELELADWVDWLEDNELPYDELAVGIIVTWEALWLEYFEYEIIEAELGWIALV